MLRRFLCFVCFGLMLTTGCADAPKNTANPGDESGRHPRTLVEATMQQKLAYTQDLLSGIAMEDFKKIERSAKQLNMLSAAADWQIHKTLPYLKFSADFRMLADDLENNAKQKNLEAVTLGYMELTMTCVKCHTHLRNEGLVFHSDPLLNAERPYGFRFAQRISNSPHKFAD